MAQRVIVRSDMVRVSKPGIDVMSAAERDLLISLGARNAQIVQRGYLPMPQKQDIPNNPNEAKWVWTIYFPAQQTRPDLWSTVISSVNVDNSRLLNSYPPTQRVTFGTSSVTIEFVGANPAGGSAYGGLIYVLFRKRVDS